ncbi:hypothetical protein B0H14DRAFT_2627364 [Mycena olivaceomarginata]|nr:hypothetical protein B0H14DRAFT_2627364 [Mycena olivaceomarginata]
MSQHNPPSNAVAHYERVPRPFSNPSVNVQFDSWSRMERNRFFSSALIFLKNPRSSTLVHTIISDNAGNNAATQGLFNNHTSYDTRWTTRATHLLNLRLQSSPHLQIKMSTRVLGTPLQARQAFRLLINPPDFQTELCEGVALHAVSFGVLYTSSMLLSNVSEGVALHTDLMLETTACGNDNIPMAKVPSGCIQVVEQCFVKLLRDSSDIRPYQTTQEDGGKRPCDG